MLFNNDQTTEPQVDHTKNYLEELVGEGKKFKSAEELARGKYESDLYINTIVRQKEELLNDYNRLKADYEARAKLEELAERIAKHQPLASSDNTDNANEADTKPVFDPDQLDDLVADKIQKLRMQERMAENERVVEGKLKERFGPNFQNVLKQQMEQLGLTEEYVLDMARRSPTAFFKTFDLDKEPARENFNTPPRSQVRSDNFTPANSKRTWSYYQKMKREQPSLYWNPKTQVQMHHDMIQLGDTFKDGDWSAY